MQDKTPTSPNPKQVKVLPDGRVFERENRHSPWVDVTEESARLAREAQDGGEQESGRDQGYRFGLGELSVLAIGG